MNVSQLLQIGENLIEGLGWLPGWADLDYVHGGLACQLTSNSTTVNIGAEEIVQQEGHLSFMQPTRV